MDKKTCEFPYCLTPIARDRGNAKFCAIHSKKSYQKVVKHIKQLESENKQLSQAARPTQTASYKGAVKISFNPLNSYQPYKVQTDQDGTDYIVEPKKSKTGLWTSTELTPDRDLFIRFAELPYTYEAYLDFVNEYGLLGLRHFNSDSPWPYPDNAEPFYLINLFQESIKSAFDKARNYKKLTPPERERFYNKLTYLLNETGVYIVRVEPTALTLSHYTLAGAIALQLYRFVIRGKEVKKCQLPGCQNLHTKRKFCCTPHQKRWERLNREGGLDREIKKWAFLG
ncbi:MAG TPA: hypothetical protein ENH19_01070 [Actinobacteria bacterium]|nr:hypothetical protein [Actinomycetes bacterium]HEX21229.1 hypothetical protein [Actinomycetota bacterium]